MIRPSPTSARRLAAALAAAALALAACSNDHSVTTASSQTPGAPSASPQAVPPSSSSASSPGASPTVPSGPCQAPAKPAAAHTLGSTQADIDGDGSPDTVELYDGGAPTPYRLRVTLGNSKGIVDTIVTGPEGGDPTEAPSLVGAADITNRGDGTGDEIALIVAHGAANSFVGFYQLNGCDLVPLRRQGEANLAVFALQGTVLQLAGVRCERGEGPAVVVEITGTSTDGVHYSVTEQALAVVDGEFQKVGAVASVPGTAAPHAGLDCFNLQL